MKPIGNEKNRPATVLASVLAVASVLPLAACGAGSAPAGSAGGGGEKGGTVAGNDPITITISVPTSSRFLEQAKQAYMEKHPGVTISIKEYYATPKQPGNMMVRSAEEDPKNIEKYVTTVSAELLGGKASDLIFTSYLPYKKYAEKGLLADIGELMKNDKSFDTKAYYENIFEGVKFNGKLYALPVNFSINKLLGNQDAIGSEPINDSTWTWNDFVSLAKKLSKDNNKDGIPDVSPLNRIEPALLMKIMVNSSFEKFVDVPGKKANFNSPEFIGLLKLAKAMYDEKMIPASEMAPGSSMFASVPNISGYEEMIMLPQANFGDKTAMYNLPSQSGDASLSFGSGVMLGIYEKSKNKKAAWDFLAFLLSENMQKQRELGGFAVNKNASKARLESLKTFGTQPGMKMMINGKEIVPKPASPEDIARFGQTLTSVKRYAESDPKVTEIVRDETSAYFAGQRSAEDTAKSIQNKVGTYLQE
ncbi:ABC transporter substrate-binding protein [Paenibacillus hamazuiensis]|uniref:ABC transporter substrate-binding protein n=1 Tax=Paenibacillus hamazuiensis TaxID=2936508 RepID=UPI00200BA54D|nr:extracellular solute-binding protein [Paenibacillus hamazuiensis]